MEAIEPAAATAASLLARGSLAGGELVLPELAALVGRRLPDHPDLQGALEQAHAQPENSGRVGALAQALIALGQMDPAFGGELTGLVAQARQAPGIGGLVTEVYGHAQVGRLVTIGQAGGVHFNLPTQIESQVDPRRRARGGRDY